ncbi:MAG: hypothetical protein IJG09_07675 [Methanobrevibacter sp.]|nr:hypothetical protein [Methanobrevibacter sp.]
MSFLKVKSLSPSSESATTSSLIGSVVFVPETIGSFTISEDVTSTSLDVFDTSLLMSVSYFSLSHLNNDLRRFIIDIENTPRIIIGQYPQIHTNIL